MSPFHVFRTPARHALRADREMRMHTSDDKNMEKNISHKLFSLFFSLLHDYPPHFSLLSTPF